MYINDQPWTWVWIIQAVEFKFLHSDLPSPEVRSIKPRPNLKSTVTYTTCRSWGLGMAAACGLEVHFLLNPQYTARSDRSKAAFETATTSHSGPWNLKVSGRKRALPKHFRQFSCRMFAMVTPQAVVKTIKEETLKFTGQDLNLRLNAAETQGRCPKSEDPDNNATWLQLYNQQTAWALKQTEDYRAKKNS